MLTRGQRVTLDIEKPAAGGAMLARASGQVVMVSGAIPGERAVVEIDRVGKGVAHGRAVTIEMPSPDRRLSPIGEPACGGCAYAEIAYDRQLQLKAEVIADALRRIGRIRWPGTIEIHGSQEVGYRMRARLHYRRGGLGWFREGTHQLCDVATTGQLRADSVAAVTGVRDWLHRQGVTDDLEIELSENVDATERVVHLEMSTPLETALDADGVDIPGLTGLTVADPLSSGTAHAAVLSGHPRVTDVLRIHGADVTLRRHVLAFFQGNRFLLGALAAHVTAFLEPGESMLDLYAGAGLFAVSAAVSRHAFVVAVEGDPVSSSDLLLNTAALDGAVEPVHQSVELFTAHWRRTVTTVVVDPPRTGLSRAAVAGLVALQARQVVYVSCDVATLARDARVLLDAGYQLERLDGFDLFPNTPHVETVARFVRA